MGAYLTIRARICLALAIAVCGFELYTVGFGILSPLTQRATLLLFAAILAFLQFPTANWPEQSSLPPWRRTAAVLWDIVAITTAIVTCLFLILEEDALADRSGAETTLDLVMAAAGPLMLLEMVRRVVGLPLFFITVAVVLYAYFGDLILVLIGIATILITVRHFVSGRAALAVGALLILSFLIPDIRMLMDPSFYHYRGASHERMSAYLWLTAEGTFGTIAAIMSQFIFIFILFAGLLDSTGAGQVFIKTAFALTGRFRGGPAQAAVVASSMFGMVSGSTMANVVSTGAFTIPLMIRTGFTRVFAGAVEAVASCGGQIVPPIMGAGVFIMSEIIGVPYAHLMLYALIPAVLYFASLSCVIYFESARLGLDPMPRAQIPSLMAQIRMGGYLLIPIVFLLASIISGETPGLAGFKAVITLLVLIDLVRALRCIHERWASAGLMVAGTVIVALLGLCFGGPALPAALQIPVEIPGLGPVAVLRVSLFGLGCAFMIIPQLRIFPVILPLSLAIADWQVVWNLAAEADSPALTGVGFAVLLCGMILLLQSAARGPALDPESDALDDSASEKSAAEDGAADRGGLKALGRAIIGGFDKGAGNAISLVAATYAIGTIVGLLVLTALGVRISILVTDVASTSLFLAFFLVMMASLIMGMGLPTVAAYLLLVIVVAPAMNKLGAPLVAAHMFIFYYGVLSSITPPVALAAYGASGLSGASALRTSVTACRLAITAFVVPYLFVYHPELLLLEGSFGEIVYRLAVSGMGIVFISMAAIGYGLLPLGAAARVMLVCAAGCLFFDSFWLNGAGVALGLAQLVMQRSARAATTGAAKDRR